MLFCKSAKRSRAAPTRLSPLPPGPRFFPEFSLDQQGGPQVHRERTSAVRPTPASASARLCRRSTRRCLAVAVRRAACSIRRTPRCAALSTAIVRARPPPTRPAVSARARQHGRDAVQQHQRRLPRGDAPRVPRRHPHLGRLRQPLPVRDHRRHEDAPRCGRPSARGGSLPLPPPADAAARLASRAASTDYGNFLQNEPSPISTTTLAEKCTEKLVEEFNFLKNQAVEPLATFCEYITYGYMIDNIVLMITGVHHDRDTQELLEKCHPLGMFDSMATLSIATNAGELCERALTPRTRRAATDRRRTASAPASPPVRTRRAPQVPHRARRHTARPVLWRLPLARRPRRDEH
jgi:hypothetical protein